ncbi:MAG: hypothetical protein ACI9FZ_000037 [Bacteroidia bacterium]|jgi:hypothetical protein
MAFVNWAVLCAMVGCVISDIYFTRYVWYLTAKLFIRVDQYYWL